MNIQQRATQEARADIQDAWVLRPESWGEALALAHAAASQTGEGLEWIESYAEALLN